MPSLLWPAMIDWLDAHAGSAQVLATVVLLLITAYYAWQTRGQARAAHQQVAASREAVQASQAAVEETRRLREEQARAHVTLELWPWSRGYGQFDLVIRNYGVGAAWNVHTVFDPDFRQPPYAGGSINELELMKLLPFLAPQDEVHYEVGLRQWVDAEDLPDLWAGTVHYDDASGSHQEAFLINRRQFDRLGSMLPQGGPRYSPPLRRGWYPVEQSEPLRQPSG
jgi:hypothetical protein